MMKAYYSCTHKSETSFKQYMNKKTSVEKEREN